MYPTRVIMYPVCTWYKNKQKKYVLSTYQYVLLCDTKVCTFRWNFVPLGKKYPEHTPFGECSGQWQEVSRAYTFWLVLRAMARSIPSIRLLASAQGNQMEVFAFMQEVSLAYAFWRVLWAPEHVIAR
jgi:hypothetical protein